MNSSHIYIDRQIEIEREREREREREMMDMQKIAQNIDSVNYSLWKNIKLQKWYGHKLRNNLPSRKEQLLRLQNHRQQGNGLTIADNKNGQGLNI